MKRRVCGCREAICEHTPLARLPVVWIPPVVRGHALLWKLPCQAPVAAPDSQRCERRAKVDFHGVYMCVRHAGIAALKELAGEMPGVRAEAVTRGRGEIGMSDPHPTEKVTKWVPTTDLLMLRRMGKLLEEITELGSVAARCIIQGIDEIDPNSGLSNRGRLHKEVADVYAQLDETVTALAMDSEFIEARRAAKRDAMQRWEAMFK